MTHLLVTQLRFARSELQRCLEGIDPQDAQRRILPLNSISWIVGHLANQENRYWNFLGQGKILFPDLNEQVGYHKPASTPPLDEMWQVWNSVTAQADLYLETLNPAIMQTHFIYNEKPLQESVGTMLLRNIYHYWFHNGEAFGIRQALGHTNLPEFVGDISVAAYHPE